jgi:hypothetical protein
MYDYDPDQPSFTAPGPNDIYVSNRTATSCQDGDYWFTGGLAGYRTWLGGVRKVIIVPTSDQDAGLLVLLPGATFGFGGLVITPFGGKYLPEVGSFNLPDVPVGERIKAMNMALHHAHMLQFTADPGTWEQGTVNDPCSFRNGEGLTDTSYLVPAYGLPIGLESGYAVRDALTAQRSALKYLHDETLRQINVGTPLEDIVASIQLPANLAASPYNQEFAGTQDFVIRSVYQEYMGWFAGDPLELVGGISTMEQAQLMVDLAGGADTYLVKARKALQACDDGVLGEDSTSCARHALFLIQVLRMTNPSPAADAVYLGALQRLAWGTTSATIRNYYLSLIWEMQHPTP